MWVRTSIAFYGNFILDMDRSPGFGSAPSDYSRPVKTWFPFGSGPLVLNLARKRNSPDRSTKSTRFISYGCSTACKHMVSGSFSLPSRGPFHLSFTVLCSIGPTLDPALSTSLSLTGLSPSLAGFPKTVLLGSLNQLRGPNPGMHASRFGLFPFRSPLLWKSMFLSLPPAT